MDPMWSVCGIRSKEIVNGAAALALNAHDAMAPRRRRGKNIELLRKANELGLES